jgi:hypothetical protein
VSEARDRDESGRPRNARARDELGRPLPHGIDGVAPLPDELNLTPEQGLVQAQRLLDGGRPFQAHEVLEDVWKHAAPEERLLWQGLAQLAVGVTHAARGNSAGAAALIVRAAERLRDYVDRAPNQIDVPGLLAWAESAELQLAVAPPGPVALDSPQLQRL